MVYNSLREVNINVEVRSSKISFFVGQLQIADTDGLTPRRSDRQTVCDVLSIAAYKLYANSFV